MNTNCIVFLYVALAGLAGAALSYKPAPKPKLTYLVWYALQVEGSTDVNYWATTMTWENPILASELVESARTEIKRTNPKATEENMKLAVLSMSKLETKP